MTEWWSYTLSDFLLFSPRTYFRMLGLYNREIWPAQIAALVLGLAVALLARSSRPSSGRILSAVLAACWLWIALEFEAKRYARINWAAPYLAGAFALEAALLIGVATVRPGPAVARFRIAEVGQAMILFAVLGYPFVGPLSGKPWIQTEIFGTAPDPTAIATLGLLLMRKPRVYPLLALIPAISCAVSVLTLLAMKSPVGAAILFLAAAPAALVVRGGFR